MATALTICVLLMLFVMTTELVTLNKNTEDENFQQLLTLVPTLTLLYGFWANRDSFCGTRREEGMRRATKNYSIQRGVNSNINLTQRMYQWVEPNTLIMLVEFYVVYILKSRTL